MVDYLRYPDEQFYWDPTERAHHRFPSLDQPSSLTLSVIIPAYNEQDRLGLCLDEALDYLKERQTEDRDFTWEIIIVDDGSKDRTAQVAYEYGKKWGTEKIRLLRLVKNRGKGM